MGTGNSWHYPRLQAAMEPVREAKALILEQAEAPESWSSGSWSSKRVVLALGSGSWPTQGRGDDFSAKTQGLKFPIWDGIDSSRWRRDGTLVLVLMLYSWCRFRKPRLDLKWFEILSWEPCKTTACEICRVTVYLEINGRPKTKNAAFWKGIMMATKICSQGRRFPVFWVGWHLRGKMMVKCLNSQGKETLKVSSKLLKVRWCWWIPISSQVITCTIRSTSPRKKVPQAWLRSRYCSGTPGSTMAGTRNGSFQKDIHKSKPPLLTLPQAGVVNPQVNGWWCKICFFRFVFFAWGGNYCRSQWFSEEHGSRARTEMWEMNGNARLIQSNLGI